MRPIMGQFALGIRSLLIKSAVFVVMAALLAWAMGRALVPQPMAFRQDAVAYANHQWYWRATAVENTDEQLYWEFMKEVDGLPDQRVGDRAWSEFAGPVVTPGALYFGG